MNKIAILALPLFFLACNKNSLELPPPKSNVLLKEKTCFYENTGAVLIKFRQDTTGNEEGKVNIEVINLTGTAINNCKLYIEMCDGEPSIRTCQNQFVYTITQLQAAKPDSITLPFRNINLSNVNIIAGIISTSERFGFLSSAYGGDYVRYVDTPARSYPTGHVRGVVFADGESIFRLSLDNTGDTTFYNITGKFSDTSQFNGGSFLIQPNILAPFNRFTTLALELPVNKTGYFKYIDNANLVKFGFKLHTPEPKVPGTNNSIDSVLFTLSKQ